MSEFRCIGKSRGLGGLVQCAHTSPVSSNPAKPEWGYLCPSCSDAPPNRAFRPQHKVELEDTDKPNFDDETLERMDNVIQENEQEMLDNLQELDF